MEARLWFVTDGTSALSCFESNAEAVEFMDQFSDEEDYDYYEIYAIAIDDLESYPDEYELAMKEGLL